MLLEKVTELSKTTLATYYMYYPLNVLSDDQFALENLKGKTRYSKQWREAWSKTGMAPKFAVRFYLSRPTTRETDVKCCKAGVPCETCLRVVPCACAVTVASLFDSKAMITGSGKRC